MGFSHSEIVARFMQGKPGKGSRMFSEGDVIYSYGYHFPIAKRLGNGVYLYNSDKYSPTTGHHQWQVLSAIRSRNSMVYKCTTDEIQRARKGEPVVLVRTIEHKGLEEAFDNVATICRERGMKPVPRQKWIDLVEGEITLNAARRNLRSENLRHRVRGVQDLMQMTGLKSDVAEKELKKLVRSSKPNPLVSKAAFVGMVYRLGLTPISGIPTAEKFIKRYSYMCDPGDMKLEHTVLDMYLGEYVGGIHVRHSSEDTRNTWDKATNVSVCFFELDGTLRHVAMPISLDINETNEDSLLGIPLSLRTSTKVEVTLDRKRLSDEQIATLLHFVRSPRNYSVLYGEHSLLESNLIASEVEAAMVLEEL